MDNIFINAHSSIQIENIFFDPFKITDDSKKASVIFITHTHYDHLSIEDINKVITYDTIIVAPHDAKDTLQEHYSNKVYYVKPNEILNINNIKIKTFPAYNTNKNFHKKEYNWVGYKVEINGTTYTIVGDTDATTELESLKTNVLFVPIGGTYTMTANEAATLVNIIKPDLVIPTHYNAIVGSKEDEKIFIKNLDKNIKYKILI